jgi:hypothetical protein
MMKQKNRSCDLGDLHIFWAQSYEKVGFGMPSVCMCPLLVSELFDGCYSYSVFKEFIHHRSDRLCGLVARVPGYRSRGLGFNSRSYQII